MSVLGIECIELIGTTGHLAFGIAYSLNDKTVIRAGGGIFFIHEIGNAMFDATRNMPFTLRIATPANGLTPNETWSSPFPILTVSTLAPNWIWKDPTSYVPQWSFTIQRAFTRDMSLETGYVGSAGVHLYRTTYYNEQQPGPPTSNAIFAGHSLSSGSCNWSPARAILPITRCRSVCSDASLTGSRCSARSVMRSQ